MVLHVYTSWVTDYSLFMIGHWKAHAYWSKFTQDNIGKLNFWLLLKNDCIDFNQIWHGGALAQGLSSLFM